MGAFYPTSTLLRNQTQLQLRIYIADKLYKDWSNLNDIESDTLQTCRDIYNIMNNSTRWQATGRVQSCSVTKFINRGGDEVAGHEMTMNFLIRDRDGVCGLPMGSYDFDQVTGSLCSPVQIYEDGILIDTIPSGGIYNVVCSPATQVIEDSLGNQLYSNSIPSGATETQVIQDSTAVLKDTALNVLSTTSILAEASEDITAPDAVINFKFEDGTPITSINYLSGSNQDFQLPNNTASNSDGSYTASVPTGDVISLPDITVTDSDGSTYTQPSVTDVVCTPSPDTTLQVNGTTEGTAVAGSTVDIQLSDSGGVVTPTSVTQVGNDLQVVLPDAGSPYDSDAKAFLDAAVITDSTISNAIDTFVKALKSNGIWNKFYAIYPFVGGSASAHKWNLKDPRDLDAAFRLTFYGGLTHNANGVTGNGLTGYAETHFNPVAVAVNRENFGFTIYSRSASWGGYAMGVTDGASFSLFLRSGTSQYYGVFDDGSAVGTLANGNKTLTTQRSSNTLQTLYQNGSSVLSLNTSTTKNNTNYSFMLFARGGVGGGGFSAINTALHAFHTVLTVGEIATFNTLVVNFQTALSRNV